MCRFAPQPLAFAWMIVSLAVAPVGGAVRIWEEDLVLPTYRMRADDPNPMFQRPLSYQGATRAIYPYALQDNFTNEREDATYRAVYLENAYLKVCVLPQLGGRLFYATDKTNGYELFYRQHVIKPAHIGMLGAWISGGIEWCAFHHHRASTFLPVDHRLVEEPDGSKTVWVGELELRHRMQWAVGIRLYPGRSWIEARIKLVNRTPQTNSFLFWANAATHVNDDYQVVFPPSTDVAVYHAKVEFVHWPIGRTRYRGVDYRGVDLSWWKNHPQPVSFFAHNLQDGFLAGIDHGRAAGTQYVANPHLLPGVKLWEWGPSEAGHTWDCVVLTDSDGPYAELMAGAYSDNQPDYSWIKPGELKEAIQTWYPLRDMDGVKAANREAALDLGVDANRVVTVTCNATADHPAARLTLRAGDQVLLDRQGRLSPAHPLRLRRGLPANVAEADLRATVTDGEGRTLVTYQPCVRPAVDALPEPVRSPPAPAEVATLEELYLTGLRIKQFHNARLDARDYFREALRRDPNDSRCNLQLGLDAAQRGRDDEAVTFYRRALRRLTRDYTRPRDCEAHYRLGLVLRRQGRWDEATDALYRAVWDLAWRAPAHRALAEIAARQGDLGRGLEHLEAALAVNGQDIKAWGLRSALLRHRGRLDDAASCAQRAQALDPLDHLAAFEAFRSHTAGGESEANPARADLRRLLHGRAESYVELAVDYLEAGLWDDVLAVCDVAGQDGALGAYPTLGYYRAYALVHLGRHGEALAALDEAAHRPTDYCFPFRLETLALYDWALRERPGDGRTWYYRGNLLYDRQPEAALAAWAEAVRCEPDLAIAHRNLGWGAVHARQDLDAAIGHYERAAALNPGDPRLVIELDRLYERAGRPVTQRQSLMREHAEVLGRHEGAMLRAILVQIQAGDYDAAIAALNENFFHIAEGRRGIHAVHVQAHLLRGLRRLDAGDLRGALADFEDADTYPPNHQTGRDRQDPDRAAIYALIGRCQGQLGRDEAARRALERAVAEGARDTWPAYYRGLALRGLGRMAEAAETFRTLLAEGRRQLEASPTVDAFAKFGEGDPPAVRRARAQVLIGLGHLGGGDVSAAREALTRAVSLDGNNLWARTFLERLKTRP